MSTNVKVSSQDQEEIRGLAIFCLKHHLLDDFFGGLAAFGVDAKWLATYEKHRPLFPSSNAHVFRGVLENLKKRMKMGEEQIMALFRSEINEMIPVYFSSPEFMAKEETRRINEMIPVYFSSPEFMAKEETRREELRWVYNCFAQYW